MKNLGLFRSYKPEHPDFPSANYACNDEGIDWYTIAWDKKRIAGKVYVGVGLDGAILSATDDGSKLFPVDMFVWEMSKSEVPLGLLENWSDTAIIDGKFLVNYKVKAESQRQNLLSAANTTIKDWRTELQLGMISDDDKASLIKGMAYIKALKVLDFSTLKTEADYNSINWPPLPTT
ncbi:tail fiber assembly protein [Enterobacter asburiae]